MKKEVKKALKSNVKISILLEMFKDPNYYHDQDGFIPGMQHTQVNKSNTSHQQNAE